MVTFLIGCAVLLGAGCAGTNSDAPQDGQGHTETSKKEQTRSPEATASEEEARCEGTRPTRSYGQSVVTNDVPGCPNDGLLLGTDKQDRLAGQEGDDEVRGLGGTDVIEGGPGNDILYGGDGDDTLEPSWTPNRGADVIYGGDGKDIIDARGYRRQPDKLYCGEGKDLVIAEKNANDYVDSSCEMRIPSYGGAG